MIDANIQLFIGPIGKMGIRADVGASNIGLLMQMFKGSLARLEKWASVQIFKYLLARWEELASVQMLAH